MNSVFFDYQVRAKKASGLRISRHGIGRTHGGQIIAEESFRYPHTPVYMAEKMMKEQYPNAELEFVNLCEWDFEKQQWVKINR